MREQQGKKGTFKGKSRTGTLKEQKTCTETAVSVSGTAKLPKLGGPRKKIPFTNKGVTLQKLAPTRIKNSGKWGKRETHKLRKTRPKKKRHKVQPLKSKSVLFLKNSASSTAKTSAQKSEHRPSHHSGPPDTLKRVGLCTSQTQESTPRPTTPRRIQEHHQPTPKKVRLRRLHKWGGEFTEKSEIAAEVGAQKTKNPEREKRKRKKLAKVSA